MKPIRLSILAATLLATFFSKAALGAQTDATAADSQAQPSEAETAIRDAIRSYVDAFNQGNAKALAAHWSKQGELITPSGAELRGREELEEEFAQYFAQSEGAKIELVDPSIQLLSPSVAVETGVARVLVPDQGPSESLYEAIHIKTAEGWKMDSVREQQPAPVPPSHHEQLQGLEWMIGDWVDEQNDGSIETTCRWTTNQNFILRSFKAVGDDGGELAGSQIIGWDPANETIRSWLFDSDGGFAVGRWSVSDNRWTVHSLHIMPDGRRASSTNIYDVGSDDAVTFRSIGRQVDGELLPNVGPVRMVRSSESGSSEP